MGTPLKDRNLVTFLDAHPEDDMKAALLFFFARTPWADAVALSVVARVRDGQEFWAAFCAAVRDEP